MNSKRNFSTDFLLFGMVSESHVLPYGMGSTVNDLFLHFSRMLPRFCWLIFLRLSKDFCNEIIINNCSTSINVMIVMLLKKLQVSQMIYSRGLSENNCKPIIKCRLLATFSCTDKRFLFVSSKQEKKINDAAALLVMTLPTRQICIVNPCIVKTVCVYLQEMCSCLHIFSIVTNRTTQSGFPQL